MTLSLGILIPDFWICLLSISIQNKISLIHSNYLCRLDFSKAVAFMSDTTNVMKGARFGVKKLIKSEHLSLYDVGCICHLADLAIKAGIKTLLIDIAVSEHKSTRVCLPKSLR